MAKTVYILNALDDYPDYIFSYKFYTKKHVVGTYLKVIDRAILMNTHNLRSPGVSLTLCCFVVYSSRRFVLCVFLFCVCVCVCIFSPLSIALTSLGEERANLSVFRTFVRFALVCFLFTLPLGVWEGL